MMKRHEVLGQQAAPADRAFQAVEGAPSGHRRSERAEIDPHRHHGLATEWVLRLGLDPGSRQVGRFLVKAAALTPSRLRELGVGSLVYAAVFLTEGLGLWRLKRWAEWLTVLITSSLVPVEAYEIYQHPTVVRVLLVLVNLGVVAYLVYRIRSDRAK